MLNLTCGSLFSGCGLGDLGIEWAGFEHRWFCETDKYAREVLAKRWPGREIYGDIQEVDFSKVERVDLLTGGFPCQDISTAGKGAGINGTRSGLWSYFLRAINILGPAFALVENSPVLVKRGLDVVLGDLAKIGYDAEWSCIPAASFGAPHKRDRIWIVAYPNIKPFRDYGGQTGVRGRVPPLKKNGRLYDKDTGRLAQYGLAQQVKLWPTPRASRAMKEDVRTLRKRAYRRRLEEAVARFPTPQASDCRDRGNLSMPCIMRRLEKGKQLNLSMVVSEVSGALNPDWVEWLMGCPIGWTDLEVSVTGSSRIAPIISED